jgi:membrane protein
LPLPGWSSATTPCVVKLVRRLPDCSAGTAQAVETMLAGASKPQEGALATLFGTAVLLFAAVSVVVQLKDAMNTGVGVRCAAGKRAVALRAQLSDVPGRHSVAGFLLLVSLIFTAALAATGKFLAPYIREAALQIAGSAISFGLVTLLFAMMFKWLLEAAVAWSDVWIGAALFELGKVLIGYYIGTQGLDSTYGAAASLVVILIWVYYSSQIVLIGAEFTHVYAKRHGSRRGRTR